MLNYIEFENAIPLFRKSDQQLEKHANTISTKSKFYILTDFTLLENYDIGEFSITKSKKTFIGTNTFSNISEVNVPNWYSYHKNRDYASACFGLVLSSLFSLATGRNIKFYRDYYNLEKDVTVAIHLPLRHAGPGAIDRPQSEEITFFMETFKLLYGIALELDYLDYVSLVRSCRLFQLAQNSKYTDHNLSYSLLVSAIESNATKAIRIKDLKEGWPEIKRKIKKVAEDAELNEEFRNVLFTKLDQHYSGIRFRKFILDYAPIGELNLESRYDKIGLLPKEKELLERMDMKIDSINYIIHEFRKHSDFLKIFKEKTGIEFENLLKDSYTYRSGFYHEGKAIQFNSPDNHDRYIKTINLGCSNQKTIASFNLLSQMSKTSTLKYYNSLVEGE